MSSSRSKRVTNKKKQVVKTVPSGCTITRGPSIGAPAPNESVAEVEYHKTSSTSFRLMANDINVRSETHNSYDLSWFVPGFGTALDTTDGVACGLSHTDYEFENVCDYTLYLRLQRPMGFKDSPSAVGMWEPVGVKGKEELLLRELRPRAKLRFACQNTSTTYMTPRHTLINGKVAVHLLSMSCFRDPLNDHGNKVALDGVALIISAETHFRVNDGSVGKSKGYVVSTFPNSTRLDYISPGPPTDIRPADTTVNGVQTQFMYLKAEGNRIVLYTRTTTGVSSKIVEGLDESSWYRIPTVVRIKIGSGNNSGDVLAYDHAGGRWCLGALTILDSVPGTNPTFIYAENYADNPGGQWSLLSASDVLRPISLQTAYNTVRTRRRNVVRATGAALQPTSVSYELLEGDSVVDTFLNSIVVIVEVVRVVAAFAATLGFLEGPENIVGRGEGSARD